MLVNALRAHLAEFGFVAAKGIGKLPDLIEIVSEAPAEALPEMARAPLSGFLDAIALINRQLDGIEKRLRAWHKSNAQSKRLETVPGVGLIGATALCALVPDPKLFRNGRHFAAWIGLTPRLDGTGGKMQAGAHLQSGRRRSAPAVRAGRHLAACARSRTKPRRLRCGCRGFWPGAPDAPSTVALANKLARIAWAIMASGKAYKPLCGGAAPKAGGVRMSGPVPPILAPCSPPSTPLRAACRGDLRSVLTAAPRGAIHGNCARTEKRPLHRTKKQKQVTSAADGARR